MSVKYLILLLFLCICLHACSASRLSNSLDKKLAKKSHFSIKNDEKNENGFDTSPKQFRLRNEGNRMETLLVAQNPREGRRTNQRMLKAMGKDSGALQTDESLVSVSWRVPHKKHGEKNPGFNLDYSPPKTHPPSHN